MGRHPLLGGQQHGRRPVVEGAGVAGGDGAALDEGRSQLAQLLHRGVGPGPLVGGDRRRTFRGGSRRRCRGDTPRPPGPGRGHRDDLGVERAGLLSGHGPAVALEGEGVLVLPGDAELAGQHLGRGAEGDCVLGRHLQVHEPPAEDGVDQLLSAGQRLVGPGQHERRPAHGLDAAGHGHVADAAPQPGGDLVDGFQAGAAQPVDGGAAHLDGEAGQQGGHAGHVAVVLPGLVGAAEDDVLDGVGREGRVAVEQGPEGGGGEVVGPDTRQRSPVPPDRSTAGVDDVDVHGSQLQS